MRCPPRDRPAVFDSSRAKALDMNEGKISVSSILSIFVSYRAANADMDKVEISMPDFGFPKLCSRHAFFLDSFSNRCSFPVNLALLKPTAQSSYYSTAWNDDKAVDGDIATCSHTGVSNDLNPWWLVDFGQTVYVTNISLVNRNADYPNICKSHMAFFRRTYYFFYYII
jgi:hypothetical protein